MNNYVETTLYLIRHGETVWNFEERFQGHGDSPLTGTGRAQARAAGERLKSVPLDMMVCSDLGRTRETAGLIAEKAGFAGEILTDNRIRERNYGILEGLRLPDIRQRHSDVFDHIRDGDPDFVVPGGESHRQHFDRNILFLEEFVDRNNGVTAAMVIHGGVLDSFFRYVAGMSLRQPRCFISNNACINIFVHGMFYGSQRWVIESWGDVSHLDGLLSKSFVPKE
ncbi:MAG: histidine phosphatase family protein [Desulfobacteraceae bacterium]|nr:histidine phosphatase family protein [Desulfobacteraceae bacterium]